MTVQLLGVSSEPGRFKVFILDALSDMGGRSELDEELHRIADKRWAALQRTGESVAWEDAAAYLKARTAGQNPRRPLARRPGLLTGNGPHRESLPEERGRHRSSGTASGRQDSESGRGTLEAIQILSLSPRIGRSVAGGKREPVVGKGNRGYVALYRYLAGIETAFILALRTQRRSGFEPDPGEDHSVF